MKIDTPTDVPPYLPWKPKDAYGPSLNNVCNYVRLLNHAGSIVEGLGVPNPPSPSGNQKDEFTPHEATYLKLLLVSSYARNAFLKIGRGVTDKLYYLDVLSASGLTYPGGDAQPVPGSGFWVPWARQVFERPGTSPEQAFDKMWAFDSNEEALTILGKRHQLLGSRGGFKLPALEAVPGDVNETLPPLLDKLAGEREADRKARRPRSLSLAFVDNAGLDVHMDTIHRLQKSIRADLVVHLPVRAIWRSIQQGKKTEVEARKLTRFFGTQGAWKGIDEADQIPEAYRACVKASTEEDFQVFDPVYIRSKNQEFALCFYARRTAGMGPGQAGWLASIRSLADACNKFTPDMLKDVLKVASGRQATL